MSFPTKTALAMSVIAGMGYAVMSEPRFDDAISACSHSISTQRNTPANPSYCLPRLFERVHEEKREYDELAGLVKAEIRNQVVNCKKRIKENTSSSLFKERYGLVELAEQCVTNPMNKTATYITLLPAELQEKALEERRKAIAKSTVRLSFEMARVAQYTRDKNDLPTEYFRKIIEALKKSETTATRGSLGEEAYRKLRKALFLPEE